MINKDKFNEFFLKATMSSIESDKFCCTQSRRRKGLFYKFKYNIWIVLLILMSPHKKNMTKKFICIGTPVNEKRFFYYIKKCDEYFKVANLNKTISDIKKNYSVLSPYDLKTRVELYIKAVFYYFFNRKNLKGYFHYMAEYYFIANYLINKSVTEIYTCVFPERYTTYLSQMAKYFKIKIIGIQDGPAVNFNPLNMLYFSEIYVFDEYEKNIIKKFIENKNCKFIYTGFVSFLEWDIFDKKEKKLIAIASQDWFTEKTIEIVDRLAEDLHWEQYQIVIFPHYREDIKQYKELCEKYPQLIIKVGSRYKNIDLLITYFSTIVYDFWSINKDLQVICLQIKGYEPSFYSRENVCVIPDINIIKEKVFTYLS